MAINDWWDDRTPSNAPTPPTPTNTNFNSLIFKTPKTIYDYFSKKLYGCEDYKKKLSTAIWSSLHLKTKTNFLVIGPSGSGKTELARLLAEIYPNTSIFDATSASPVSYKGNCTISDSLMGINTDESALPPWLFIDEIDKMLLKGGECGPMVMNELLKITEGGKLFVGRDERNRTLVDTSRVNFVFLGTFESLRADQKNPLGFSSETKIRGKNSPITRDMLHDSDSLSNEFLGRINGGILEVEPMDEAKTAAILSDARYSPVKRLEDLYHINIHLTEEKRQELLKMTAKYGVRGIYSELQSKINDAIFEDCTVTTISL
ncbi:MAG: AAA family ATPase [Lachnospiraceae bacterium]|nr:AAA family ATPase [Lachnospiraceae bacterium]